MFGGPCQAAQPLRGADLHALNHSFPVRSIERWQFGTDADPPFRQDVDGFDDGEIVVVLQPNRSHNVRPKLDPLSVSHPHAVDY